MRYTMIAAGALAVGLAAGDAAAAGGALINADGKNIGTVTVSEMEQGVRIIATAEGIPPGVHAFHVHETGECDPATDFKSAGGHYNPTNADHGWDNPNGPHAGDLPNVHVQDDGVLAVEYFTDLLSFEGERTLFDDDGSAVIVHRGADDYQTEPSGDAGARIACAVIEVE